MPAPALVALGEGGAGCSHSESLSVHSAARSVSTVISGGIPRRRGSANVPSPGFTYRKADF